jgi:hypothetical protein
MVIRFLQFLLLKHGVERNRITDIPVPISTKAQKYRWLREAYTKMRALDTGSLTSAHESLFLVVVHVVVMSYNMRLVVTVTRPHHCQIRLNSNLLSQPHVKGRRAALTPQHWVSVRFFFNC